MRTPSRKDVNAALAASDCCSCDHAPEFKLLAFHIRLQRARQAQAPKRYTFTWRWLPGSKLGKGKITKGKR